MRGRGEEREACNLPPEEETNFLILSFMPCMEERRGWSAEPDPEVSVIVALLLLDELCMCLGHIFFA